MPEVDIRVADRTYRIGCGEGEQDHLAALAQRIDAEASRLASQMGQVNEGRLLVMSALLLADKLAEAEQAVAAAEEREGQAADRAHPVLDPEREAEITANLDALSERIEQLVGRIEATA
ncbi:MAG: cell division protein ZapA [Pseudomonadota bacterium]